MFSAVRNLMFLSTRSRRHRPRRPDERQHGVGRSPVPLQLGRQRNASVPDPRVRGPPVIERAGGLHPTLRLP